jgi:hypothetical protein
MKIPAIIKRFAEGLGTQLAWVGIHPTLSVIASPVARGMIIPLD